MLCLLVAAMPQSAQVIDSSGNRQPLTFTTIRSDWAKIDGKNNGKCYRWNISTNLFL